MNKFSIFALVAMLFVACTTDQTADVQPIDAPETLTVSFEENTRIQLQNGKTVWTKGDLVSVFYKSYDNLKFKFDGETGDRTGTLSMVNGGLGPQTIDHTIVIYPYSTDYRISLDSGGIDALLPATQYYAKDSYGIGNNLMVAQSEFTNFSLRNTCGWLKLQLTGNGKTVKSITLKGNNGEQVAGLVHVNTADATLTLATTVGDVPAEDENGVGGIGGGLVFDNTILTEVTLDCGDGVALDSKATAFYIALPPQTFEAGFTMNVAYSDGTKMTKSTSNALTIVRNTIQPMETLYYDGNLPPVYELAYTTNDGEPLDPYTTEGFGSNFVENIYDAATGNGMLKFDGKITTIPAKAFVACTNLTHINLPEGITAINAEAFSGCSRLALIDIPQGVKTIGDKAFYNCSRVNEITIPSSVGLIGTSSFEGCGGKATINCRILELWFYKAKFTQIAISDSVTYIGVSAFEGCNSLTSVIIPNNVTEIDWYAFKNCSNLKSVTIPDSITKIGASAFYGCSSLTSVHISDLSAWCKIDFYQTSPGPLHFGSNPLYNGAKLYLNGSEITELTIPSDITEIKNYAFYNCKSLTNVTIGNRVTSIGDSAFYGCNSLTSATIGKRVTSIGGYTFMDCSSLESVTIPDSVTSIGEGAFQGCSRLESVTIPDSVTSIGEGAFQECSSLESVTIPDSVTSIGEGAFQGCQNLTSATIGNGVTSIGDKAFYYCKNLTNVHISDLSAWCQISFSGNGTANPLYYGAKLYLNSSEVTELTIPSDVTKIENCVFCGFRGLTSIIIHNRVTSIGNYAFAYCGSLTSVTIPESVTEIGNVAFAYCSSLRSVYCKPTTPPGGGINMFSSNASDRKIYVPASDDDSIINAYKTADYWSNYANYIFEYNF